MIDLLVFFHHPHPSSEIISFICWILSIDRNFQGLNSCTVNFASEAPSAWTGKAIRMDVGGVGGVAPTYNVTIDLRRRVGRWLKVELEFNSTWLLLSEVTFNSGNHSILQSDIHRIYYVFYIYNNTKAQYRINSSLVVNHNKSHIAVEMSSMIFSTKFLFQVFNKYLDVIITNQCQVLNSRFVDQKLFAWYFEEAVSSSCHSNHGWWMVSFKRNVVCEIV